jgi:PEP-CTERM motif
MRGNLLGAIAAIVIAAGLAPAHAVTLNTGGTATYNFDLSGLSPPGPPFALLVHTFFGLSGVDAGDVATFRWFDGPGATGANVKTDVDDPLTDYVTTLSGQAGLGAFSTAFDDGILDGVFSVVVKADQGSFGIVSALADGLNASGLWILEPVGTLVAVTNVPEPASLALLGGGLAAALALRRRRPQAPELWRKATLSRVFRMAAFVSALAAGVAAGSPSRAAPIERHFVFDDDGVIVGSGSVTIDSAFYHGFPVEYFTPIDGLLSLDFTIHGVHFDIGNALASTIPTAIFLDGAFFSLVYEGIQHDVLSDYFMTAGGGGSYNFIIAHGAVELYDGMIVPVAVPEPSGLLASLAGLVATMFLRRRPARRDRLHG